MPAASSATELRGCCWGASTTAPPSRPRVWHHRWRCDVCCGRREGPGSLGVAVHGVGLRLEDRSTLVQLDDTLVQAVHVLAVAAVAPVELLLVAARAWHARRSTGARAAKSLQRHDVRVDGVDIDLQNQVAVLNLLDVVPVLVDLLAMLNLRLAQDTDRLLEAPQLASHELLDCTCGRRTHAGLDLRIVLHAFDVGLPALKVRVAEVKSHICALREGRLQSLGARGPLLDLGAEVVEPVPHEIHLRHVLLVLLRVHAVLVLAVPSPKLRRIDLVLGLLLEIVDDLGEAPLEIGAVLVDVPHLLNEEQPNLLRRAARLEVLEVAHVHGD